MNQPITDMITTTVQPEANNIIDKITEAAGEIIEKGSDLIKVNVNNPTIDLSNSPYVKYAIYGIIILAIYFLFFNKKTSVAI
jgi:hypothetical protein